MTVQHCLRIGGVPEHFNLPWHLALASQTASDRLTTEWIDYSTGTGAMLADLVDRQLDLAVLLTEGAALGVARQLPIEAISLYTTSPLIWGVHVPAGARYREIAELEGARFAISRYGSGSHLMSLALAMERGWLASGLQFEVVNDLPGAIDAFREGRADAFLWEHFTTQPVVDAGDFRRVGDFVAPWPAWVLCAHATVWRERQADIEHLFARVCRHAGRLAADPNSAAVIAARYGLAPAAVEQWLGKTEWVGGLVPPAAGLAAARAMLESAAAV